jgi:hypothetical protein
MLSYGFLKDNRWIKMNCYVSEINEEVDCDLIQKFYKQLIY